LSSSSEQNSSKCRTISKVHFASRLFTYNCCFQLREHKKTSYRLLTSWHNRIFKKLRTIEAKNP